MTEDIYVTIGSHIREARLKARMTQEQLGEKADIHYSFLGYIERGSKKASVRPLKKIADALEIHISNLFRSIEIKPRKKGYSTTGKLDFLLRDRSKKDQEEIFQLLRIILRRMDRSRK